jgi:tetraacyldisaccharide 4'-kinase
VQEYHATVSDVPVIVNPDRVAGAATARREHGADCLVLDDGFQHRRLRRDLDLVLVDAIAPAGEWHLLPAGKLREPLHALQRADALVITRANQADEHERAWIDHVVEAAGARETFHSDVVPTAVVDHQEQPQPPESLADRRLLGTCGIGNPRTFAQLLRTLVGSSTPVEVYGDHHDYRPRDAARLVRAAHDVRAAAVVTTRKDWVKLAPLWPANEVPLLRLDVRMALREPTAGFEARLRAALEP